jgi:hypothetical protein
MSSSGISRSNQLSPAPLERADLYDPQIIGPLAAPLPPTLPPSPPASRSASPVLGSNKRKLDTPSLHIQEHSKRPRNNTPSTSSSHLNSTHPHSTTAPADPLRTPALAPASRSTEPREDGEVPEEAPSVAYPQPPGPQNPLENSVPIRRPRRGQPGTSTCERNHTDYYERGRKLKYSGDARHWSTFPISNKDYKSLPDPPPPNSPYHKYGGLIARLELIDALVCFAYALWNKDRGRQNCNFENWVTIDSFLGWCKTKWTQDASIADEKEKAFVGLM